MADRPEQLLRHIRQLVSGRDPEPDAVLLERFRRSRDEAAFAELVRRHGAMVLGVCRRILRDEHQAEDASQATFLVLVRKAGTIRPAASLAAWLHSVARHLALKCRRAEGRRRLREAESAQAAKAAPRRDPLDELIARELLRIFDEELQRLAEVYRLPLILCGLEGLPVEEAARQLGWAPGSVRGRLARGRARLHARLARRGVILPAGLAAMLLAPKGGDAAIPAALSALTAKASRESGVSARAAALAEAALRSMRWTKLKVGLALLLTAAAAVGAGGLASRIPLAEQPPAQRETKSERESAVLNRAEPDKGPPAHADRHGDRLPPGAVARLGTVRLRHPGGALVVTFSPDGKILASGGRDNMVRLWDVVTGKQLHRLEGHKTWVQALAFTRDGKVLASGTSHNDRLILLWDTATGKQIRSLSGHPNGTTSLAFSPDGKNLASSGDDGEIWVRAKDSGKELLHIQLHQGWAMTSVAYAPDGRTLASGSALDPLIRLWDAATGKELRTFRGHGQGVPSVAFAPDGKTLASGGGDNTVRLWNVSTGKELRSWKTEGWVRNVAFAPDGQTLAAVIFWQGTIRVWNIKTAKEVCKMQQPTALEGVALAPDGKKWAGAGRWNIRLWDPATGKDLFPLRGPQGIPHAIGFVPDGKTVTSVNGDDTMRVWDAVTGEELRQAKVTNTWHWTTTFAPDGRMLAVERGVGYVRVWDAASGTMLRRVPVAAPKDLHRAWAGGRVQAAACTPDGKTLAVAGADGIARVWDLTTGKEISRVKGNVGAIEFAPDGKTLALYDGAFAVRLCDVASGKELSQLKVSSGPGFSMAFAPDGKTMAALGIGTLNLWDVARGERLHELKPPDPSPFSGRIAFAPGGRTLAAFANQFALWDVLTGKVLGKLTQRGDTVRAFAFSPDGRTLALAMQDHTVRLWDAFTGREIRRFHGHQDVVGAVAYAPDGRKLVSGSWDGTGLIWDLTGGILAKAPGGKELPAPWDDLGGSDAPRADRAFWTLVAARGRAVSLVRDRLAPARPADRPPIGRLVAELDDDAFAVRQKAEQELARLGERAGPALRAALAKKPSLEARRRIERLLAKLERKSHALPAVDVRAFRAVRVLEQIGTAEARAVLEGLSDRAEEPGLAAEALAAFERLARRK